MSGESLVRLKQVVDPAAMRDFFVRRLANPKFQIAIADCEGAPSGYIAFEWQDGRETAFNPARPCLFVHHICVAAEARRQGIGTALLRHAEECAAAERIDTIALNAWAANDAARRFFAARGFGLTQVVLRKTAAGK